MYNPNSLTIGKYYEIRRQNRHLDAFKVISVAHPGEFISANNGISFNLNDLTKGGIQDDDLIEISSQEFNKWQRHYNAD